MTLYNSTVLFPSQAFPVWTDPQVPLASQERKVTSAYPDSQAWTANQVNPEEMDSQVSDLYILFYFKMNYRFIWSTGGFLGDCSHCEMILSLFKRKGAF